MAGKKNGAFSFAHLMSFGASRAEADPDTAGAEDEQDDERKQREDESDEDYAQRMAELDEQEEAEENEDDATAAESDEDDDAGATPKERAARAKERARCAAIFGSKAAGNRPDFAAHLAFKTSMSANKAIGMLSAFAAGSPVQGHATPRKLGNRMAGVQVPNVGANGGSQPARTAAQATADRIIAAGRARRGLK